MLCTLKLFILDLVDATSITSDPTTCNTAPIFFNNDSTMGVTFDNTSKVDFNNTFVKANRNLAYRIKHINWSGLFNNSDVTCANVSNMSANLKGVPQCLNSDTQIKELFADNGYDVSTCTDGEKRACDSNMYTSNGINTAQGPIDPEAYNHNYGCLSCLLGVAANYVCSRDNFAIRPNEFNSSIAPNQNFTAEQNATISFYANKFNGTGTTDYNVTMNTSAPSFVADITISDSNKTCAESTISISPNISFIDGLRVVNNNYYFSNVGDFNLTIHEVNGTEYAEKDNDDTPDVDRFITPFTRQIKVIPASFQIDGNFTNAVNNFTYLSNFEQFPNTADRNMAALLDLNISARGANNTILSNYTSSCYAKDGNLTTTLSALLVIDPSTALTKILWHDQLHNDVNGSTPLSGGTSYLMDFNHTQFDSTDINGTAHVQYRVNFDRTETKVVKPVLFPVSTVSLTDNDATGSQSINQNATFYYGRAHAPDYRFPNRDGNATIYYEVYCKDCNRTSMGITGNESINAINWYQNALHVSTAGIVAPLPRTSANFSNTGLTNVDPISIQRLTLQPGTAIPYIDKVDLNSPSWLVHYPTDFTVEFYSSGSWAGAGFVKDDAPNATDTNTTVGEHIHKSAPTKAHKRLTW